jgi:endonuclease-3
MDSKCQAVAEFLAGQKGASIRIGFGQVAEIMGGLPDAAYTYRAWWSNNPGFTHARHGWLAAGWRTARVDMEAKELTFERVSMPGATRSHECLCGCGGIPSHGDFLPGHDQRLRTRIEEAAGGLANLWQIASAIGGYLDGDTTEVELGRIVRQHWRRSGGPAADSPRFARGPAPIASRRREEPETRLAFDLQAEASPIFGVMPDSPGEPGMAFSDASVVGARSRAGSPLKAAMTARLKEMSQQLEPDDLLPALLPDASALVKQDPYAFCLATCLDRGMPSEIVWTIPYDLQQTLGHLDPNRIDGMQREELAEVFGRLPRQPRFVNDAPDTVKDITRIIVHEYAGKASGIWEVGTAAQVKATFRRVHGVGPGIASMAVLLIEKVFGVRFGDLDHASMDIKADVHTTRVLYRLGLAPSATVEDAIEAARRLVPEYPGEIDGALWRIGKRWCRPERPDCGGCPMNDLCPRVGVQRD